MERNTEPEKMHLSSEDEHKGIEPVLRATQLVRDRVIEDFIKTHDREPRPSELPTIYVTSFAYILGGWKAMVSTSQSNGHYYEVTHNNQKRETYVDRYSKDYNVCIPDPDRVEIQNTTPSQPTILNIYPPTPSDADLQRLRERLQGNGRGPTLA
jgi:hypothetical protein